MLVAWERDYFVAFNLGWLAEQYGRVPWLWLNLGFLSVGWILLLLEDRLGLIMSLFSFHWLHIGCSCWVTFMAETDGMRVYVQLLPCFLTGVVA